MWQLYCCVLILAVCACLNKHAIAGSNPFSIQLINVCVSLCLAPIWYYFARKTQEGDLINKAVIPYVVAAAVLSTIGFVLFLTDLKNKPASVATSVLSTYPMVALLIGCSLGLEKFSMTKLLGIGLTLIGIIITVCNRE